MDSRKRQLTVILSISIGILFYLAYKIVKPFLLPILWAVVLGIAFQPLHRRILKSIKHNGLASATTLIVILLIVMGPVAYLGYRFVSEIIDLSHQIGSQIQTSGSVHGFISDITDEFLSKLGAPQSTLSTQQIDILIENLAKHIGQELRNKASEALAISFDFLVMTVALFFVLRDGSSVVSRVVRELPLSAERKERIRTLIADIISSSFYGTGVSMGLHGALGLLLFVIFSVPMPILLASAVAVMSVIPIVGSTFVWIGVIISLFIQHRITAALFILAAAAVGTQAIEHWLRPLLIGAHGHIPFVIVFFGILGGLEFFGLIGLILGPLILILLQSLVAISLELWKDPSAM